VKSDDLSKGQQIIEDMIDENRQEELRKMDQDKYESPSLFLFKYDGIVRSLCIKIVEH
jgi:hypothetical protein